MAHAGASASEGIERLKSLVQRQLKEYGAHHPSVLFTLGCLARLRQRRQEYGKAEHIYRKALELSERVPKVPPHIVRMLLAGYAGLLCETGRSKTARWLRRRSRPYLAFLRREHLPQWKWQAGQANCPN